MFRFCIPLPGRDHIGRKVVYINTGGYDPNVISLNEVFRVQLMTIDTLIQDEHTQVKEYHLRFPFKDMNLLYCVIFTGPPQSKKQF